MIELSVTERNVWEEGSFMVNIKFDGLVISNEKVIDTAQRLIKAAMELLPDNCKGEIELLEAVHRTLDSKVDL